jgi:hypothetical protein
MTVAVALAGFVVGPLERRVGAKALLVAGNLFSGSAFVVLTFARTGRGEVYCASASASASRWRRWPR